MLLFVLFLLLLFFGCIFPNVISVYDKNSSMYISRNEEIYPPVVLCTKFTIVILITKSVCTYSNVRNKKEFLCLLCS